MPTVTGRAVQVSAAGGAFQLVQKEFPEPGPGHVRIRVQACGVCHSDLLTKLGLWPGIQYPRIPGHEDRRRRRCRRPRCPALQSRASASASAGTAATATTARPAAAATSSSARTASSPESAIDGGYADYVIAPANALAFIPDDLSDVDAAPLLCAGITTYNSLRNSGARPGDTVAILGIGGLGHLGVQYAAKSGYRTVAIARGADKGPLAKQLGAHIYIDSTTQDPAAELQKLGGAAVILSTLTNADALASAVGGLAPGGKLIIIGVPDKPFEVNAVRAHHAAAAPSSAGPPAPAWTLKTRSTSAPSPALSP